MPTAFLEDWQTGYDTGRRFNGWASVTQSAF